MLALFVVRGVQPVEVAAPVVRSFSRVALGAVLVLVSTGTYQAWREVRSWAALTATTYGRELLVKLVLVACVIGIAVLSRTWVRRGREDLPALRRRVSLETAGVVLVLGVTSALVATQPAASAYHPSVSADLAVGPDTVRVSAVPAGDRRMQVQLYVFDKLSRPTEPAEVSASLTLPGQSIGPLPLTLTRAGKGHRIASVAVPILGDWTMTVLVRTTAIDEYTATIVLPIH
jgi:copper transport protein